MQIERSRRNGSSSHLFSNGLVDGLALSTKEVDGSFFSPASSSSVTSSPSVSPSSGVNYIEHRVTRMDTLAGVAIKYGVEVADIKRMNGLVTDLQMFAHKSLQIPLPGRHPPSPIMSNGSSNNGEQTPPRRPPRGDVLELFELFKLKPRENRVSPAMSSLQGYYGLSPPKSGNPAYEGTEMAVYRTGRRSLYPPVPDPPSPINGLPEENGKFTEDIVVVTEAGENSESAAADRSNGENSVRRRQKADVEPSPELLLREDSRTGKGGASLRAKSRTDSDTSYLNGVPFVDSFMADGFVEVRRSSSTSNLQESDGSSSSFIWPTTASRWALKTDYSIARPIFDGLPKPMAGRKNKAALD